MLGPICRMVGCLFFALLASPLSFSRSLYPCVTNEFGSKVVKIKMGSTSRGDHCTNLNFRAMMKPKKKEKNKHPRSCHKTFRTSPLLVAKVEATKGQRWQQRGRRKKGCHRFATHTFNWSSELQFYFRFRIDVPHMPHVARTIPSFLHRTHSIEHAVSLSSPSLSLSLFILSFSIFGAHLQARPDNNKRDTKNVTQDLRRFLVAFPPPTSHYI